MRKHLLTLALLTAFAAPAVAQTIYDEPIDGAQQGTYDGPVELGNDMGVDDTTTGSIAVDPVSPNDGACERGAGIDAASNPQCNVFGGNSN